MKAPVNATCTCQRNALDGDWSASIATLGPGVHRSTRVQRINGRVNIDRLVIWGPVSGLESCHERLSMTVEEAGSVLSVLARALGVPLPQESHQAAQVAP